MWSFVLIWLIVGGLFATWWERLAQTVERHYGPQTRHAPAVMAAVNVVIWPIGVALAARHYLFR
jgi:cobalamin biosynthesis protein CobD/CbiB